jgi:ABC-type nickel/cobalt efflux system permease component RcnA
MRLADGISRLGFRKWYERELLQSHGHMALTFLCAVGIVGALEAASNARSPADRATDLLTMLLCAGAGLWSLRRYLYLLSHAEAIAHQADCPQCGTYARLRLVGTEGSRVLVGCRQCGHEWPIDDSP